MKLIDILCYYLINYHHHTGDGDHDEQPADQEHSL